MTIWLALRTIYIYFGAQRLHITIDDSPYGPSNDILAAEDSLAAIAGNIYL